MDLGKVSARERRFLCHWQLMSYDTTIRLALDFLVADAKIKSMLAYLRQIESIFTVVEPMCFVLLAFL